MKNFLNKQFYLILFFLTVFFVVQPGISNASINMWTGGEYFEVQYLGIILDDFMLQQKFVLPDKKYFSKPKYTIEEIIDNKNGTITYTISKPRFAERKMDGKPQEIFGKILDVTVDKNTQTVVGVNFIVFEHQYIAGPLECGGPKDIASLNVWHDSWVKTVSSRYGNPTETGEDGVHPYANFKEDGKYQYYITSYFHNGDGKATSKLISGPATFAVMIKAI